MANAPTLSTLAGKTVVVTGASDGIGKAAVRAYVAAGASVVMIGRNEAKTAAAAQAMHWQACVEERTRLLHTCQAKLAAKEVRT
jgi:NAD(P)-dependent dehydrogenase (short-subunit alcohol dehydrogenase family)